MGIFSSKKKHFVDTSVMRVIEDGAVPNPLTKAILESRFKDQDLVATIQQQALHGGFRSFDDMYQYAAGGDYFYGLPDARILSSSDGDDLATAKLSSSTGRTISSVDYMYFRPLNNVHAGWMHLYENMGYNGDTNEIASLTPSAPNRVYLVKLVAIHDTDTGVEPDIHGIGSWEGSSQAGFTPATPVFADEYQLANLTVGEETKIIAGADEAVEIHYAWEDETGTVIYDHFVHDLSGYDTDQEYYHAKYTYTVGAVAKTGYWVYSPKDDTGSELNQLLYGSAYQNPGTYFPFAVFRSERENRAKPEFEGTAAYDSTVKLLSYLDMDFQELSDSLHENEEIDYIEQAIMMMGVPITTDNTIEIDYLHRYFSSVYDRLPPAASALPDFTKYFQDIYAIGTNTPSGPLFALEISDADFRMTLSFDSLTRRYQTGTVGDIGDVTNTLEEAGTGNLIITEIPEGVAMRTVRILRKQVTANAYEEIRITGLKLRYHIVPELGVEGSGDDERVLIPLDREVVKDMPILHRETLYYRSLHFVFNSYAVQFVKWYERGAFKILLTIVAVVITILTYGATWKAALVTAGELSAAAFAMALLDIVLSYVIEGLVVKFLFTELVSLIGVENALWLAIAAAAVGGARILKTGELLKGSTAQNLISAANGLTTGAQEVLKDLFSEYQADVVEFNLLQEEKWAELEEAQDLLDTNSDLDPFTFVGREPLMLIGEPPESYLNRLAHTPNPGAASLNIIQNFIENSLTLPKVQETLGDSFYV